MFWDILLFAPFCLARAALLFPFVIARAGISSSFIRTSLALVTMSASYARIASPDELVSYPTSLASFWIFIGGNVLLQLVRIYYNRFVLSSGWNKEESSGLRAQLLLEGEHAIFILLI